MKEKLQTQSLSVTLPLLRFCDNPTRSVFILNLVFGNMHINLGYKTGSATTSPEKLANLNAAGEATHATLYPLDVTIVTAQTGGRVI